MVFFFVSFLDFALAEGKNQNRLENEVPHLAALSLSKG